MERTRVQIDARVAPQAALEVARVALLVGLEMGDGVGDGVGDGAVAIRVLPDAAAAEPVADPMRVCIAGQPGGYSLPGEAVAFGVALRALVPPGRARMIGVLGTSGGLGASTLAAVLAAAAGAAGWATVLADLDPLPGGCAETLDLDHAAGLRWADLARADAPLVTERLMAALPRWRGVRVLCGDEHGVPGPGTVGAAVAALRSAADVVVLDLPRSTWTDPHLAAVCDDLVILAGAAPASLVTLRSVAAAQLRPGPRRWLAVRRASRYACPAQEAAHAAGLPLLGVLGDERGLADALAVGDGPWLGARGPLRRLAARTLDALDLAGSSGRDAAA